MDCSTLRSLVECPVCFEVRKDCHYYLCSNHCSVSVCQVCLETMEVRRCPQCDGDYGGVRSEEPKRNRTVEKLIENSLLELACKYARLGCGFACTTSRLSTHEVSCPFRIVSCTYRDCNEQTCANRLDDHVESFHVGCVNSGCKFNSDRESLEEHHPECLFREVICPGFGCQDKVQVKELLRHLKMRHKGAVLWKGLDDSGPCSLDDDILKGSKMYLLEYDKETFFIVRVFRSGFGAIKRSITQDGDEKREEDDDSGREASSIILYSILVQVIGRQTQADAFQVSLGASGDKAEITKTCNIHPIDESDEDLIVSSDDTYQITEKQLRQCRDGGNDQSGGGGGGGAITIKISKNSDANIKQGHDPISNNSQTSNVRHLFAFGIIINIIFFLCLILVVGINGTSLSNSTSGSNFTHPDLELTAMDLNDKQVDNALNSTSNVTAYGVPSNSESTLQTDSENCYQDKQESKNDKLSFPEICDMVKAILAASGNDSKIIKKCKVLPTDKNYTDCNSTSDDNFQVTEMQLKQCDRDAMSQSAVRVTILKTLEIQTENEGSEIPPDLASKNPNFYLQCLCFISICIDVFLLCSFALDVYRRNLMGFGDWPVNLLIGLHFILSIYLKYRF